LTNLIQKKPRLDTDEKPQGTSHYVFPGAGALGIWRMMKMKEMTQKLEKNDWKSGRNLYSPLRKIYIRRFK